VTDVTRNIVMNGAIAKNGTRPLGDRPTVAQQ
jgi:hypothetical protein